MRFPANMELQAFGERKQVRRVNGLLGLFVLALVTPLELLGEKDTP